MTSNPGLTNRINKRISLPSPSLQDFLRNVITNEAAYLRFLEDTPSALLAYGLQLDTDISAEILTDFRFAVDRARCAIQKAKGKLHFEDVFKLPVVTIHDGNVIIKQHAVASDTRVDVYYSEQTSSENRGSHTDFSAGMTPTKSTDRWSTKSFGGTSIFEHDYRQERFSRCPLISAEILRRITTTIAAQKI